MVGCGWRRSRSSLQPAIRSGHLTGVWVVAVPTDRRGRFVGAPVNVVDDFELCGADGRTGGLDVAAE